MQTMIVIFLRMILAEHMSKILMLVGIAIGQKQFMILLTTLKANRSKQMEMIPLMSANQQMVTTLKLWVFSNVLKSVQIWKKNFQETWVIIVANKVSLEMEKPV